MGEHFKIVPEKVKNTFDERAKKFQNIDAVLDANESAARANVYRDYVFKNCIDHLISFDVLNDEVLDFGCGVGRLSVFISPKVKTVTGVDISNEMIKVASNINAKDNIQYKSINAVEDLLVQEKHFDKILICWVLQHVGDDVIEHYLDIFSKVLKPGGRIYIFEQVAKQQKVSNEVIHQRSENEYIELLKKENFDIILCKPILRFPSYSLSLWIKYAAMPKLFLPLLTTLENLTVNRKPEHINYQTLLIEAKKK